jgi:hypothetical protein
MASNNKLRGLRFIAFVFALLLPVITGAQAATFTIVGGTGSALTSNFFPTAPDWVAANNFGLDVGSAIKQFTNANAAGGNGLFVAPGTPGSVVDLTFTYEGSEAGFQNLFEAAFSFTPGAMFDNKSNTNNPGALTGLSGGLVPLLFRSIEPGNKDAINGTSISLNIAMAFAVVNGGHTAYAFFEDLPLTTGDKDFDDLVVRIDAIDRCVSNCPPGGPGQTPLPAAIWLFGTVLAGGAGVNRWRKRKAKNVALGPA